MAMVAAVALTGTHAYADPSVAEIEAQIATAWNEAEPLIEKYNAVHEEFQKNKTRQEQLQQQIAPLQREVDLAQLRVGVIAERAYKGGPADQFGALLAAGSPGHLAEQLTFLDQMAREESNQIAEVVDVKSAYDAQKAPIDALVADLAKQDADLTAQRTTIEAKLANLQQLRVKAYGAGGGAQGKYRPWTCPSEYLPTNGYKAAAFACAQAGKPYVWAAAGPNSYDCSGLVLAGWKQVGVYLPHNAAAQRRSMPYVSRADIQIGDLVFYFNDIHHVAMYVGDGHVINAPNFGDVVRMTGIDTWPVHSIGRP
jgi:cell wall-associated NlpC family hydrolase